MYKLMIVEDEPWIAKGLENALNWEEMNIQIVGMASNGLEALEMTPDLEPDILLTDIMMPIMDGMELLEQLSEKLEALPHIIVVTGYDDFNYAQKALRHGVVDYILKPIDPKELKKTIAALVKKLEQQQNEKKLFQRIVMENTIFESLSLKENRKLDITLPYPYFNVLFSINCIPGEFLLSFPEIYHFYDFHETHNIYVLCYKEKIEDFLKIEAKLADFQIGVSSLYRTIDFLVYDAFKEAEEYFLKKYVQLQRNVEKQIRPILLNNEREKQFIQILKAGDKEQLCDNIVQLFANYPIFEQKWSLVLQLYLFLSQYVQQTTEKFVELIYKVKSVKSERELEEVIETIATTVFESFLSQNEERGSYISRKAVKLIEQKYKNPFLSLREIAEELKISPAYLSVMFKNEIGINFIQFLTKNRIDCAKKELLESKKTVTEISNQCGFNDVKYFLKVFKKEIGLTPNQFRGGHQV